MPERARQTAQALLECCGQVRFRGLAGLGLQQSHGGRFCHEQRSFVANHPADCRNALVLRKVDQLDDPVFAAAVVLRFVIRQYLRNCGGLAGDGPVAADRTQQPTSPRGDFHVVVLGGRGEGIDGIKTDLAQVGLGLLPDEVIGIAQGLDQALDPFRRTAAAAGGSAAERNLRKGNEKEQQTMQYCRMSGNPKRKRGFRDPAIAPRKLRSSASRKSVHWLARSHIPHS